MCIQGEGPDVYWKSNPMARKEHKCCECGSIISVGERYELFEAVWDGEFGRYKTCTICCTVRDEAQSDLRLNEGIVFGCLWETVGVEYEDIV